MRWLKNILVTGLLLAAGVVVVGTLFSDHSAEYGKVGLPDGGFVHLPQGTVTVYLHTSSDAQPGSGGLAVQVIPAAGGEPLPLTSAGGSISAEGTQRSEVIGEHGAIGKVKVPQAGEYRVVSSTDLPPGAASLEFGTNPATALAAKWKLLAALVGAAFLIALIPTPRHKRRWQDDPGSSGGSGTPSEWSAPPTHRAPYTG